MRDTVVSIILTQAPIAVACLWVAWEMRAIRKSMDRIAKAAGKLAGEPDREA